MPPRAKKQPAAASQQATAIEIPLDDLTEFDGNVRRTGADEALDELEANIKAVGLLTALVVKHADDGKYIVVAGNRRLRALKNLAAAGQWDKAVPCLQVADDADATEISLAENAVRLQMHPADQFEAFQALTAKGKTVAEVAARFGVSEGQVEQRLKLAKVSPDVLQAYRARKITLEHLQAFTISDDHKAQNSVLKSLSNHTSPRSIRNQLTKEDMAASDSLVTFIGGLDAYLAAGGQIKKDLFAAAKPDAGQDDDAAELDGIYLTDSDLVNRLVEEKLQATAEALRAEGWKWVEIDPEFSDNYRKRNAFARRYPEHAPLTDAQRQELETIKAEWQVLEDKLDAGDEPLTDAEWDRYHALNEQIEDKEKGDEIWADSTKAIAGAIVSIGYHGEEEITRGLIRKEDLQAAKGDAGSDDEESVDADHAHDDDDKSRMLDRELRSHRAAAYGAHIASAPHNALAVVTHMLAAPLFYGQSVETMLVFDAPDEAPTYPAGGSAGAETMQQLHNLWKARMPATPDDLLNWLLFIPYADMRDLFTYCVGAMVQTNPWAEPLEQYRRAAEVNLRQFFVPTVENTFGKMTRAQLIEALKEAEINVTPAVECMDKADLAEFAERTIAPTDWLPETMRLEEEDEAEETDDETAEDEDTASDEDDASDLADDGDDDSADGNDEAEKVGEDE